jgi:dipeptidyl aminopeptidase/acylaminoacyl peptidase
MQLPVVLIVEGPSRADLAALLSGWRGRAAAVLLIALLGAAVGAAVWWLTRPTDAPPHAGAVPLRVTSAPAGATVRLDGRVEGRTPLTLEVEPGEHDLLLQRSEALDERRRLTVGADGASVHAELWRRTPRLIRLRPAFPGAIITGADFLRDGRVAVAVALPAGEERQLWLHDPSGGLERVGPPEATGSAALSPDGGRVAYLVRRDGSDATGLSARLDELRLARTADAAGEPRWWLASPDEQLTDLGWAPDGNSLLLVSSQRSAGGGLRSRLLLLAAEGAEPRELVALPGEIVPGSYVWSPDGGRVAFLAQAGGLTALCLADLAGPFRYLADLSHDDPMPLPFPPVAWSPDGGRLLYAAPTADRTSRAGWLFGPAPATALYGLDLARPLGQPFGEAEGQSPAWRRDGTIVAFARTGDGPLLLRTVAPDGATRDVGAIGLAPSAVYAARWDTAHAQALIATRASASLGAIRPEFWLVRFGEEAAR